MNRLARSGIITWMVALAACTTHPPMTAPAPVQQTVSLPPAQVVQRAAQRLVADGFTIVTSDATGGVLTATLSKSGAGSWGPFIACRWSDSSMGHANGTAMLTARLTAQAAGDSSHVYIASTTRTVVRAGMLSSDNETDCASSGTAEQHVMDALLGR